MKHHELAIEPSKSRRRSGRGISAGRGKTAGRGTKGQSARSGGNTRRGFEGGQVPLQARIPKMKGFKARPNGRVTITTAQINKVSSTTVDAKSLQEANVIDSEYRWIKIINKGEVSKKHTVKVPAASEGAIKAIEKAGGSFMETEQVKRQVKTKKD